MPLGPLATDLKDPGGHGSHGKHYRQQPSCQQTRRQWSSGVPDANLIPVTAISPRGDGDFMDIRGIQWVANKEAMNIRVLNLSLTATPRVEYWKDPMNQAVMKTWEAGIAVVVAAGNDGMNGAPSGHRAIIPTLLPSAHSPTPGRPQTSEMTIFGVFLPGPDA